MRHRFHLEAPLPAGTTVRLTGEEHHHASRVVRVRQGEEVEVFDGRGVAATGVVETVETEATTVRLIRAAPARESQTAITLAMAIIQLDKFELVLQKATELGVVAIIPLVTKRVEVRPERYRGKGERWERIVLEAVKQCGRARIPQVEAPLTLEALLARDGVKVMFDAGADPSPVIGTADHVTLLVGPEGGWSDEEIAAARASACALRRLGARRLRAETAAIAAVTIFAASSNDI